MDGGREDLVADDGDAQVDLGRDVRLEDHRRVADVLDQPRAPPRRTRRVSRHSLLGRRERLADHVAVAAGVDERARLAGSLVISVRGISQADLLRDAQLHSLAVGDLVAAGIVDPEDVERVPQAAQRLVGLVDREDLVARRRTMPGARRRALRAPPPDAAPTSPRSMRPRSSSSRNTALAAVRAGLEPRRPGLRALGEQGRVDDLRPPAEPRRARRRRPRRARRPPARGSGRSSPPPVHQPPICRSSASRRWYSLVELRSASASPGPSWPSASAARTPAAAARTRRAAAAGSRRRPGGRSGNERVQAIE